MDQQRQQAFDKLRPSCVELVSVALRFKGQQAAVKDVLRALEDQHRILQSLGLQRQLDEKLAGYSFFPLTQVLAENQRLSPRCLQVAADSLTILVSQGWRSKLDPELGQRLLVLMSLLGGGGPNTQAQSPSDELRCAAFKCIETLLEWLARTSSGKLVLQDQGAQNVVDQIAFLLVESLSDSSSDDVQIAAADALHRLHTSISNRVFLASLLPRTVSSLVKALQPNTQARRTRKVLVKNLSLLGTVLKNALADEVVHSQERDRTEIEALDSSWLKATAAQVKNALLQIAKLRTHSQADVRDALGELCIMVIRNCGDTLKDSISTMLETLVVVTGTSDQETATTKLRSIFAAHPELTDMLQSSFFDWCQSLPRVIQGSDDRPKELVLTKIASSFNILDQNSSDDGNLASILSTAVIKSVANVLDMGQGKNLQIQSAELDPYTSLVRQDLQPNAVFEPIFFNHQSESGSSSILHKLIENIQQKSSAGQVMRDAIDKISSTSRDQTIAASWLALRLLTKTAASSLDLEDILDMSEISTDTSTSRSYLIYDLYSHAKDILLDSSPYSETPQDSRLVALAMESLTLQAQQLGVSYRTELYETLYPVLALLSSRDGLLHNHAITTLNHLATSCNYASVSALLVENVDYLVNGIAWKLNTFNLSPEAPAVLNMIVRLVGARLIPHLDDLIASIFTALDSYHGYTQWVERLFEVLKTMVDECTKETQLAIISSDTEPKDARRGYHISSVKDIITDLRARKKRKLASGQSGRDSGQSLESAPRRPWTRQQDDPNHVPDPTEGKDFETLLREAEIANEENDLPAPNNHKEEDEDPSKPQNKTHDLLLKIARATVPHLSSPSPRVRHLLLQLLAQICPLLARHENSFLPLINSIWPGVVQRLLADPLSTNPDDSSNTDSDGELPYNIAAAADIAITLCVSAGDFMTSRIEKILPQLKITHARLWKEAETQLSRQTTRQALAGPVDLQVIPTDDSTTNSVARTLVTSIPRSSTTQLLTAQTRLLATILTHVTLPPDRADEIFVTLAPLVDNPALRSLGSTATSALHEYNPDKLWVLRWETRGGDGAGTPVPRVEVAGA